MSELFNEHFEFVKRRLEAAGEAAKSFHHKTNKGNIREIFVRELLESSTSNFVSVGSSEIIHRNMKKDEIRNQIDVVLYNNRYPKVPIASGTDLYFVETVSSFVEVKSVLTKEGLRQAAEASKRIKSYPYAPPQNFNPTGMIKKPRPYSFVFAYESDAKKIETIAGWMKDLAAEQEYNIEKLKKTKPEERSYFPNLFIDGVFVLGKGFVCIDALPTESRILNLPDATLNHIWFFGRENELQHLWLLLNIASEQLFWNDALLHSYLPRMEAWACE